MESHTYYILLKKNLGKNPEKTKKAVEEALKQYGDVEFMDNIGQEHGYKPDNYGPGYKLKTKTQLIDETTKIMSILGVSTINIFSKKGKHGSS